RGARATARRAAVGRAAGGALGEAAGSRAAGRPRDRPLDRRAPRERGGPGGPARVPREAVGQLAFLARVGPDCSDVAETERGVGEARDLDDVARVRRLDEAAV